MRQATCSGARADGKTFACESSLKDAANNIQGTSLNNTTLNGFAAPDTNVYDTLESKREMVGSLLIKRFWMEAQR